MPNAGAFSGLCLSAFYVFTLAVGRLSQGTTRTRQVLCPQTLLNISKRRKEGVFSQSYITFLGHLFRNLYHVLGVPRVQGGAVGGAQA